MVQVSFSTSTTFAGNENALVEDQETSLTARFDLDEPAPAGGLSVYVDSDVEQIVNRLDLPGFAFDRITENIDPFSLSTNFDNSGFSLTLNEGATNGSFTIDVFDNPEPDTFLPETFDGLVEAEFSLLTQDQVAPEDVPSIGDLGDYTIDPNAASSTVLFADEESQLSGGTPTPTPTPTPDMGYDEAVSGDISNDPGNPLDLPLPAGTTTLSASTGDGDQEYVTVTVNNGFELESLVLESYAPNDVGFIGVQEGTTFTEPLDDSAIRENILGYTLFGNPRQIGTDILDEIGNGLNAQGFDGPLPSGDYTFALQQLGASSDYTLAFNVTEATVTENSPPVAVDDSYNVIIPGVAGVEPPTNLVVNADDGLQANDSDADNDNLTVAIATAPEDGNVTLDADGSFTYTPNGFFADEDSFTYTVSDGNGGSDTGNVTIITEFAPIAPPGLPVVSFEAVPATISEEGTAEERLLQFNFTVEGEIPEGGLVVLFENLFGITDQSDGEDDRGAFDGLTLSPPFDLENNIIGIRLLENEASLQLPIINDLIEETTTFDFRLASGEGYIVDPDQNSTFFTITDDNGGPGVGPTVGLSVSETNLEERQPLTVNFTVEGDIPDEGVDVLVESSESGALGQFDLANLDNLELTGISGVPRVGDTRGGSFIVTLTDEEAAITTSVFDDIVAEDPIEIPFSLANGELYEVDPDASEVLLTIADEPQPVGPTVGITLESTSVVEGDSVTLTFDVIGDIPPEGVTVLVNDTASADAGVRSLTEFDVANITLSDGIDGFPIPAEGDSGFFVTITEPTANITLPVLDDGADEEEELEVFTFEVIDGEAYEPDPDANSVTLNISDPETMTTPIVSFEAIPATISEEDTDPTVVWQWTVTGDLPEEGLVVNFDSVGENDIDLFTQQFSATREVEFINSDLVGFDPEFSEDIYRLEVLLSDPDASFVLPIINDILEEGEQTFDLRLASGEGYTVDPDQNATLVTISDDNGGPGVGPAVGISATATDLAEGDEITINFTAEGDIPEAGVQILVQSPVSGALGQFDLADLSTLELAGIAGLPEVGDASGSSFFVTLTEPTASITTSVFDDIIAEEPLELPFTIANGEEYEVDADASSITLNIVDEEQPEGPTVGLTVDQSDVVEGDSITLTFNVEGEIPDEGVQVLVNDLESVQNQARSLTEFDVANIELTGIDGFPTPADGDSGFFVTITEPTATITLPVFDEGADEDEASESFTFEVIDGEAYEVDPDASAITINISDSDEGVNGWSPGDSFNLVTPPPTYEGELTDGELSNAEFVDQLEGAALLEDLQAGGYVIYFRHARTERDFADQVTADVTDFSTQRVLSEFGIQQSLAIGEGFELSNIPYDDVITSEYGRAIKTAAIAFGEYQKDSDLNFLPFEDYTDEQVEEMRVNITPFLTEVPVEGTNTIIVGHDDLFEAGTGIYPDPQGIAYLLKPDGNGEFDIIANLLPEEWVELSEAVESDESDEDTPMPVEPDGGIGDGADPIPTEDTEAVEGYQPGDSFDLVTPSPTYEGELSDGELANAEFVDQLEGAALLDKLQAGGHVIYFRHARTERDFADQVTADVNNFSTQRVVSEFGVQQSLAIGEGFELSNIPYDDVITSEYGRAIETAAIAFGEYQKDSDLNFLPFEDYTDEQVEEMRVNITPFLTEVPVEGTNTIIVGHDDLFEAGTGIYPDPQGIAYILEPDGEGSFEIIANLLPEEWVELSADANQPTDGDDVLNGNDADDLIAGLLGDDTLFGNGGDDVLRGDRNSRSSGGSNGGNDVISGGNGNDQIGGKGGNDLLSGDAGDDLIWGDDGNDTIMGGAGDDILAGDDFSGGNGSDLFVFGNGDGTDLIIDFNPMQDTIALERGELTFEDIEIIDRNGSAAISVISTGETLAVLESVSPDELTSDLFMVTPDISFG
ncbi:MAG: Ig-like domain-containing protein [Microcoleaceae cyanobacterium]